MLSLGKDNVIGDAVSHVPTVSNSTPASKSVKALYYSYDDSFAPVSARPDCSASIAPGPLSVSPSSMNHVERQSRSANSVEHSDGSINNVEQYHQQSYSANPSSVNNIEQLDSSMYNVEQQRPKSSQPSC